MVVWGELQGVCLDRPKESSDGSSEDINHHVPTLVFIICVVC